MIVWYNDNMDIELVTPQLIAHYRSGHFRDILQHASVKLEPREVAGLMCEEIFASQADGKPIFAVDVGDLQTAIESAMSFGIAPLPPLPFPEIVFESTSDRTWYFFVSDNGSEQTVYLDSAIIYELEPGEKWRLMCLTSWDPENREVAGTYPHRHLLDRKLMVADVMGDGTFRSLKDNVLVRVMSEATQPDEQPEMRRISFAFDDLENWEWHDSQATPIDALTPQLVIVEIAHYVTAKGIEHEVLPRPTRRRFERQHGQPHPEAWYVVDRGRRYKGGSLQAELKAGVPREHGRLHHRFMVRGHWRQYSEGRSLRGREMKGKRVWIAPYIKGPAGAPWKASPVRINVGERTIEAIT